MERSKAQLELDWQRRYEDLERLQYVHSEDLVKSLSNARNEVLTLNCIYCGNDDDDGDVKVDDDDNIGGC